MIRLINTIGTILLMTGLAQADVILINDDFSTSTINNDSRLSLNDAGDGSGDDWRKNSASLWNTSGGNLNNPGTTVGVEAEGAVGQLYTVTTTDTNLTKLRFEFNYTVGTGSRLYFHATGLTTNGSPSANEQLNNTGAENGNVQNQAEGEFADISIITGRDPANGTADAISFAPGTSGTYNATFDLSGYSWSADESPGITGTLGNITSLEYLSLMFSSNVNDNTGAGAISIDNFRVTAVAAVPEPSSFAVLVGGLGLLAFRRRSHHRKSDAN